MSDGRKFQKFCFGDVNSDSYVINIVRCTSVEVGYFLMSTSIPVLFNSSFNHHINPGLIYKNHMKDVWYHELYGYSYTTHME